MLSFGDKTAHSNFIFSSSFFLSNTRQNLLWMLCASEHFCQNAYGMKDGDCKVTLK